MLGGILQRSGYLQALACLLVRALQSYKFLACWMSESLSLTQGKHERFVGINGPAIVGHGRNCTGMKSLLQSQILCTSSNGWCVDQLKRETRCVLVFCYLSLMRELVVIHDERPGTDSTPHLTP
jgi:hypothetical protein